MRKRNKTCLVFLSVCTILHTEEATRSRKDLSTSSFYRIDYSLGPPSFQNIVSVYVQILN